MKAKPYFSYRIREGIFQCEPYYEIFPVMVHYDPLYARL